MDFPPKIRGRIFELRTVAAPAFELGPTTVTPLARVLAVRGPGFVIVRSRPTAVQISANGQVSRIRIRDVTRVTQAVVVFLTTLCVCYLVIRALGGKERRP